MTYAFCPLHKGTYPSIIVLQKSFQISPFVLTHQTKPIKQNPTNKLTHQTKKTIGFVNRFVSNRKQDAR